MYVKHILNYIIIISTISERIHGNGQLLVHRSEVSLGTCALAQHVVEQFNCGAVPSTTSSKNNTGKLLVFQVIVVFRLKLHFFQVFLAQISTGCVAEEEPPKF